VTHASIEVAPGARHLPGYLDRAAQQALTEALRAVVAAAPLFVPVMPRTGKPFSVRMTNCGRLGWVSDRGGYRYQPTHPDNGAPWPPIPPVALAAWDDIGGFPAPPEACLINFYSAEARMGPHQDRDEAELDAPVVSLSLGDSCIFRVGGATRGGPTRSVVLQSGDAFILAGPARLAFHGVDRIIGGSSTLLPHGGRINLTLRRVEKA
jgi:alkylated DNA repair protein (DNA oxidative demethylase)